MFIQIPTESVLEWVLALRPSFRRRPEFSKTIVFVERTFGWIPRSSRGMTMLGSGMTVLGGAMTVLDGGMVVLGDEMTVDRGVAD